MKKFIELNEVREDLLTHEKYDAVRFIKCNCDCHSNKVGSVMMHFKECCDNGIIEERRYINNLK